MMDRYTHFVDKMRKEATTKMDAILKPVTGSEIDETASKIV